VAVAGPLQHPAGRHDLSPAVLGGSAAAYVPRNRADMPMDGNGSGSTPSGFGTPGSQDTAFNVLNAYINGEDCLREHRGTLLPRNTCRNPWMNFLNARLAKVFNAVHGQSLEGTADVFYVLAVLSTG